jgi:hypothetical protein
MPSLFDVVIGAIPSAVWRSVGVEPADVRGVDAVAFGDGTGAASGQVQLVTATLSDSSSIRLVRKTFSQLATGPHAAGSRRLDHWAHWNRELTAYRTGVLPTAADLRAPRLLGAVDETLYLEYVGDQQPTAAQAAVGLGRWHRTDHAADHAEDHPWLARHQLAQRVAVSDLDWSTVDLDEQLREIWQRRASYLSDLEQLPWSITHGDFSTGNLRLHDDDLVVVDWATLGVSPVGFDLAHLALATLDDSIVEPYLDGLQGRYEADAIHFGYRVTVALVGASRAHWMASRSIPLPPGYLDFVLTHAT